MERQSNSLGVESLAALEAQIRGLVDDPGTSGWLRSALIHLLQRDPVDACKDIRLLDEIATVRVQLIEQHALKLLREREVSTS